MREHAYRALHGKLLGGEFAPGTLLSEVSLAREFGISRTPLREAMGQLVAEGFLEQIPSRGTVVARFARQDIVELYELREALEIYAARKAAARALSEEHAREFHDVLNRLLGLRDELVRSGQPRLGAEQMQRLMGMDIAFHSHLLRLAGNGRILKVVGDTRLLMRIFSLRHEGHTATQVTEIHRQHRDILEAVLAGDPGLASGRIAEHIRTSMNERLEAFDQWEQQARLDRVAGAW